MRYREKTRNRNEIFEHLFVFCFCFCCWVGDCGKAPVQHVIKMMESKTKTTKTKIKQRNLIKNRLSLHGVSLSLSLLVSHLSIVVAFHNCLTDREPFGISSSLHFPSTSLKHLSRQTFFSFFDYYIRCKFYTFILSNDFIFNFFFNFKFSGHWRDQFNIYSE